MFIKLHTFEAGRKEPQPILIPTDKIREMRGRVVFEIGAQAAYQEWLGKIQPVVFTDESHAEKDSFFILKSTPEGKKRPTYSICYKRSSGEVRIEATAKGYKDALDTFFPHVRGSIEAESVLARQRDMCTGTAVTVLCSPSGRNGFGEGSTAEYIVKEGVEEIQRLLEEGGKEGSREEKPLKLIRNSGGTARASINQKYVVAVSLTSFETNAFDKNGEAWKCWVLLSTGNEVCLPISLEEATAIFCNEPYNARRGW